MSSPEGRGLRDSFEYDKEHVCFVLIAGSVTALDRSYISMTEQHMHRHVHAQDLC